jgi:S-DNA-T family DNA segregation ATPase FtsK/SpoIIIE
MQTTDRAGSFVLLLGLLTLIFGLLLLLGAYAPTVSPSLVALKKLVLGLGGQLGGIVAIWLVICGFMLCVASKHSVPFSRLMSALSVLLCVLALMTLTTRVGGYGPLLDYVSSLNAHFGGQSRPESMGAYLVGAFNQYYGKLTPLPGGGLLGMLVAYPLWKMLSTVGAVLLISFALIASVLVFLHISPTQIVDFFRQKTSQAQRQEQPENVQAQSVAQATVQAAEQVPEQAPVHNQAAQPAQEAPQESYVVYQPKESEPSPVREGLGRLFNPQAYLQKDTAQKGFAQKAEDIGSFFKQTGENARQSASPYAPPAEPLTKPKADLPQFDRFVQKQEDIVQTTESFTPISYEQAQEETNGLDELVRREEEAYQAALEREAEELKPKKYEQMTFDDVEETPIEKEQPQTASPRRGVQTASGQAVTSGTVHQVGVDAAYIPTGKRISVQGQGEGFNHHTLDGSASRGPVHKEIEKVLIPYIKPDMNILSPPPPESREDHSEEDRMRAEKLISTLKSFSVEAKVHHIVHGPAITRFAIRLGAGISVSKLKGVLDNLSVELLAKGPVRAEIPIPGTPLIGIEVSNNKATPVYLREVLESDLMKNNPSPTLVALGKDVTGQPIACELTKMPHLLIAGATGSGKSVCINSIVTSLLYRSTPQQVRLILVDPKFVELQMYSACPHLLLPVISDGKKVVAALEWLCEEMDERYQKMQQLNVRNIAGYNERVTEEGEKMPIIVMIIDEMADLIATNGKAIEEYVQRITAKARAAGIVLILATQRPSVNVITGVIKANIPSRIAFQVAAQVDSRTIIDTVGAEGLLGSGDMLYLPGTQPAPTRIQGCFISDQDVETITNTIKRKNKVEYNQELIDFIEKADSQNEEYNPDDEEGAEVFDELLPEAIQMAVEAGQTSISMLQRVLRVGYGRAGRLIDEMERRGLISESEGSKPRRTLISREQYNQMVEDYDPRLRS